MRKFNIFIAIAWTAILAANIAVCAMGGEPSWVTMFCALGVIAFESWMDVITWRK